MEASAESTGSPPKSCRRPDHPVAHKAQQATQLLCHCHWTRAAAVWALGIGDRAVDAHLLTRVARDDQLDAAVQDYRRARRILSAMAQVDSLQGIHDEATLIMRGLSQVPCGAIAGKPSVF